MTKKEIEKRLQAALKQYGWIKIRLLGTEKFAGEGIWAVPADADSARKAADDSSTGEQIKVYLGNQPVFWNTKKNWGDLVLAKTDGQNRPVARAEDNQ